MGLNIAKKSADLAEELVKKVDELIDKGTEAKKAKDFALADKIRDELTSMGSSIEDTRQGVKWKKM